LLNYRDSPLYSDAERAVIEFGLAAGEVPNATTRAHFEELRKHFTQGQIVEMVSVISLFGWLNRWNDTFASDLEDAPKAFATNNLAARGWNVGKHAAE
jgi:alkylhydroperoxidase family enzyme